MKGYLQRLAASVINPGLAVRPLTGSVFTRHLDAPPAAAGSASTVFSETSETTVPKTDAHEITVPAMRAAARDARREPAPLPMSLAEEHAPLESQPTEPPRYRPLVKFFSNAPVLPSGKTLDVGFESESSAPEPPREIRLSSSEPTAVEFKPRLSERPAAHEVLPLTSARDMRPAPVRTPSRPGSAQPSPAQAAEPDIQIHIGRIEVVAAAPPVRPVAPAPRRSMSLDDYLKRSDARTR